MTAEIRSSDQHIIERYTDQPARLPLDLRRRIEQRCGGLPVQLYALADLDVSMNLSRTWVTLGPRHISIASQPTGLGRSEIRVIDREQICGVREAQGLSCNVLTALGQPGEPALFVVRYTHRQRRAMENIIFLLEEQIAGRDALAGFQAESVARGHSEADAAGDPEYVDGLVGPIRQAQAMVARNELAVLWRLLAYLVPYRKQLTIGMSAAALITLCSLVPPYLAGFLIDDVVEASQNGLLPVDEASRTAWLAIRCSSRRSRSSVRWLGS